MRKIILSLIFTLVSLVGFGQEADSVYYGICDCHGKIFKGYILGYRHGSVRDTLLYYNTVDLYNEYKCKSYYFVHYTKYYGDVSKLKEYNYDYDLSVPEIVYYCNNNRFLEIEKDFKYGFISEPSWSMNSVNGINFKISYTNTNSKTIKYIDIYFIIKNPVGDICKIYYNNGSNIGHLRCVGPLEQFCTGTYSWEDSAVYYTTGDASNLVFTKFIITYMDNTKYTLVKELTYSEVSDKGY